MYCLDKPNKSELRLYLSSYQGVRRGAVPALLRRGHRALNQQSLIVMVHGAENIEYWDENYILKDVNKFSTTVHFGDCECEINYIHSKCLKVCPRCGAQQDDCPDSRTNEVFAALMANPEISDW